MKLQLSLAALVGATLALVGSPSALADINVTNTARFAGAVPTTPAGAAYVVYCGGTSQPACLAGQGPYGVSWGSPASSLGKSRLAYAPNSAGNVGGASFTLGTLTHVNAPILEGIDSVGLTITTTVVDTDAGPLTFTESVPFTLDIDETPNDSSDCPGSTNPCPDFIRLPSGGVTFPAHDVGHSRYVLHLDGFRASGGQVTTTMTSQEQGSSSVALVGHVEKTVLNQAPSADAGSAATGTEGGAVTLTGGGSDPDGDAVTPSWTYDASGADPGTTCSFSDAAAFTTTISCTDDGPVTATLEVSDAYGGSDTDTVAVSLGNAAPELGAVTVSAGAPVPVGTAVTLQAPFTDAGSNDTHTCTADWGDGTSSTCSSGHVYTAAGVHTVTVTVTDDDGAADTASSPLVVVYDPSAGFVTGGGWIDSPAGAFAADPSSTGRANFGFNAKYKKGASTPDGQTQFQFQAGSLSFHSTSYDWLVVAGTKAQYKGSGTVNGVDGYQFMLSARDGSPDRFRMRIWNAAGVVYDNQGGDVGADASQAISGGSIVIHTR